MVSSCVYARQIEDSSTDIVTTFVMRDKTANTVDTGVVIANLEMYYQEERTAESADVFVGAHGAVTDAHTDGECIHIGHGSYRVDWPDAAFDGGVGTTVRLILVDGDGGAFTEILEIELTDYFDPSADPVANVTNVANAVLSNTTHIIEQLQIVNGSGTALIIQSGGGNGDGMFVQGNGTGNGMDVFGGVTGDGIYSTGGNTSGHGMHLVGANAAGTGSGFKCEAGGVGSEIDASISGALLGSITGNIGGNVTGNIGSFSATAKSEINAEIVDVLKVDTIAEPTPGVPSSTPTFEELLRVLYWDWSYAKLEQTATTMDVYAADELTVLWDRVVSDDAVTFTRGEVTAP